MAPGPALTFARITPQQFSALSAKAQSAGIGLDGNAGSATKFGVEVSWKYTPETQTAYPPMPQHALFPQTRRC